MNAYLMVAWRNASMWHSRPQSRVAAGGLSAQDSRIDAPRSIVQRPTVAGATTAGVGAHGCAPGNIC